MPLWQTLAVAFMIITTYGSTRLQRNAGTVNFVHGSSVNLKAANVFRCSRLILQACNWSSHDSLSISTSVKYESKSIGVVNEGSSSSPADAPKGAP